MAEATSNRIIFLPASKSNVTRMQRKKKKEKIHYESRRVNFSCQVDIEARIFLPSCSRFHSTWPQNIHWKAKFFFPSNNTNKRLDRYSKQVVPFCWNDLSVFRIGSCKRVRKFEILDSFLKIKMFFEWSSMIFGEEKESKSKRNGKLSIKTAHVEPVSCLFWSTLQRPRSQCIAAWCTCTSVSSSNCMIISHWSPRRARFMVNYYSCWSFPPLISPFIFIFSFLLHRSSPSFILARITASRTI